MTKQIKHENKEVNPLLLKHRGHCPGKAPNRV